MRESENLVQRIYEILDACPKSVLKFELFVKGGAKISIHCLVHMLLLIISKPQVFSTRFLAQSKFKGQTFLWLCQILVPTVFRLVALIKPFYLEPQKSGHY